METNEENPDHVLEFFLSDLKDQKDRKALMTMIYESVLQVVNEKDIVGCDYLPFGRAPKKVQIQCRNAQVKDTLLVQGFELDGSHICLREPMDSPMRVVIQGAPTYVKNVHFRQWLSKYCTIIDCCSTNLYEIAKFLYDHV